MDDVWRISITRDGNLEESHLARGYLESMREGIAWGCGGAQRRAALCKVLASLDSLGNFVEHRSGKARRGSVRREATASGVHFSEAGWHEDWEEEFLDLHYSKERLRYWAWIASIVLFNFVVSIVLAPVGVLPEDCAEKSPLRQGRFARFVTLMPVMLNSLFIFLISRAVTHNRRYPMLAFFLVILGYSNELTSRVQRERVRGMGSAAAGPGRCSLVSHMKYSSGTVPRTCIDTDPYKTLTHWPFPFAVGCNPSLVDSGFANLATVQFLSFALNLTGRLALLVAASTSALLAACLLVLEGRVGPSLVYGVLLQMGIGCVVAALCHVSTQAARQQFSEGKHSRFAAEQSRKLLYTLIPPNVLARLAKHSTQTEQGMLSTDIPHCTILFCKLTAEDVVDDMAKAPILNSVSLCVRVHTHTCVSMCI